MFSKQVLLTQEFQKNLMKVLELFKQTVENTSASGATPLEDIEKVNRTLQI